jgi:hypothetical protein
MNDPQMLGHVFAVGALYLFCRWKAQLSGRKIFAISALCVLGLFTKHSLLSVPFALGVTLLWADRRDFFRFVIGGTAFGSVLLIASVAWNGYSVITNVIQTVPTASTDLLLVQYKRLFLERGLWALGLPILLFWRVGPSRLRIFSIYSFLSFTLATLAMRGSGQNHLFDFFIAVALLLGICAGLFTDRKLAVDGKDYAKSWRVLLLVLSLSAVALGLTVNEFTLARFVSSDGILEPSTISTIRLWQALIVLAGTGILIFYQRLLALTKYFNPKSAATIVSFVIVLAGSFIPIVQQYGEDLKELDYQALQSVERRYLADVRRLRSTPGPALFEEALIGFDAGKDFVFDPFLGSTLMEKGRLSEDILIDRIKKKDFGAIVLTFKIPANLEKFTSTGSRPKRSFSERWTDNTLRAIADHYEPDYQDAPGFYFFYRPKT